RSCANIGGPVAARRFAAGRAAERRHTPLGRFASSQRRAVGRLRLRCRANHPLAGSWMARIGGIARLRSSRGFALDFPLAARAAFFYDSPLFLPHLAVLSHSADLNSAVYVLLALRPNRDCHRATCLRGLCQRTLVERRKATRDGGRRDQRSRNAQG